MDVEYSLDIQRRLAEEFRRTDLERPMRVTRYDTGTALVYDVSGVVRGDRAQVRLVVERFVGGGFAGQVYRVKVLEITPDEKAIDGLQTGGSYALKILVPPSTFSRLFRNTLYWIGFQGPFQLQLNPAAARSGALWQKLIRRGAGIRFGDERHVADIHATLVDHSIGSCGDLGEWIDGRTWRLEVDDHIDLLGRWVRRKPVDEKRLGSPEYRAKYTFMHEFVRLLHDMGGYEFARQYEWSTWKSQPNCLKRSDTENSPADGLVAVDFRAGLALLPFLPMSPGDVKLIATGVMRGSLVQFDRGDLERLRSFVEKHRDEFSDMTSLVEELTRTDDIYRHSIPDVTHNHVRLLYSSKTWSTILNSAVTGWKTKNLVDDRIEKSLRERTPLTLVFGFLGWIPLLGPFLRRLWGQPYWRRHYGRMFSNRDYLNRAFRGGFLERMIDWHRKGRITDGTAATMMTGPWRFAFHLPLALLPAGLHRFFTDWAYAKDRLNYVFARPARLYFNAKLREEWLRDMVKEGRENHLLREEDADVILSQVDEPFIQKYLKSLAVHVCTLPITQLVSGSLAVIYVLTHPEMPRAQAWGVGLGIIALFQLVPISPGSLARGLYVVYLVARERNFKDYNIAVFLGFFKYVGYLAFPIQMTYRFPTLARFMAAHWATGAVHIVPVFGERGALLEHGVFRVFYNWPLTIRRRMERRAKLRATLEPRYWHIALCGLIGTALFGLADVVYFKKTGEVPNLKQVWWLVTAVPLACGAFTTRWAAGAKLWRRVIGGAVCGAAVAVLRTTMATVLVGTGKLPLGDVVTQGLWSLFFFTLLSTVGVLVAEVASPQPEKG
jgi:hypothetical protein